jgi:tetratricopeptide (TPR) repeat protein
MANLRVLGDEGLGSEESGALAELARVELEMGRGWDAIKHARRPVQVAHATSERVAEADALIVLAQALDAAGRAAEARRCRARAYVILDNVGDHRAVDLRAQLDESAR